MKLIKKALFITVSAEIAIILLLFGFFNVGFWAWVARVFATTWLSCLVYANLN